jgi:BTB/POZ domain
MGIVALMVESLMREKKDDERSAAVLFKEEREAFRYI